VHGARYIFYVQWAMPNTLQLRYEKEFAMIWLYFYGTNLQTKRVDKLC